VVSLAKHAGKELLKIFNVKIKSAEMDGLIFLLRKILI